MKQVLALALSMALAGSLFAQDTSAPTAKRKVPPKKAPSVAAQLTELKEAIEAQQKQILDLGQQLQSRDQQIQQLQQRLDQNQASASQAQAKADAAASQAAAQGQTVNVLQSDVADLKVGATNAAQSLQETQKSFRDAIESPLAIHYKGITITPGGFLAAESIYRTHALGADINTPFNSVNMPGAGQDLTSEFFGSGRQSRITMLAEGQLKDFKMSGYYEADFLSAAVTSNNNESNSYSLRQRQVWGQAATPSWTFTGGQMWSLVTETKKGMDNRTEAVPLTIDPQYTVGFSWARQYGVRLVRNFGNHFWLGAALENPQTTLAERNAASNFALGSTGTTSGLYNGGGTPTGTNLANYSFNSLPDFIFKAAAEPGFGHYEVFAILSRFRDRVYPCAEVSSTVNANCGTTPSTLGVYNDSLEAGGIGGNARVTLFKHLDFGVHALTGSGIGRYGTGGLPDATVNPTGTLAPLRSYQGLLTMEYHTKKIDFYLNGGEEYVKKHWAIDPVSGKAVGYGSPLYIDSGCYTETLPGSGGFSFGGLANCQPDTQSLIEGTAGFWIRVHQGPHGRIQFGPQYSYVVRNSWWGTNTTGTAFFSPHGIDNMFFTSFRYYLP
jgi:hypothetical protein